MTYKLLIALFAVAAAWAGAGCDGGPRSTSTTTRITHGVSYGTDSAEQRRFKEAVAAAKIPHEISKDDEGKEFVRWADEHHPAIKQVQESLFGPPMPPGNNVSYLDGNEPFKAWLTANGIPFTTSISHGREFVITAEEDQPRVAQYAIDCKTTNGQVTAAPTTAGPQAKVPPSRRGCGPPAR